MSSTKENYGKINIIRVDIVDNDFDLFKDERIQETYYIINPNIEKLERLQQLLNNRNEDNNDDYINNFNEIGNYIKNNFDTIDISIKEIEW